RGIVRSSGWPGVDDGQRWNYPGSAGGGDHGADGSRYRRDLQRNYARIPRAGEWLLHRRVEGDCGEWMVRGASVSDRKYLQDLCGELPGSGPSAPNPGGSSDNCQRCFVGVGSVREIMSDQPRVSHPIYNLLPTEIEGFDSLAELALDMRWSWSHATDGVWRTLDPLLWELTQNPWVVLQTVARDQIERVLADPGFR